MLWRMRLHVLVFYSADDCSVLKLLIKNSYKTHAHYTLVCSLGPEGTGEGSQLISSLVLLVFHYFVPSKQRKKVKNSYKIWKTKKIKNSTILPVLKIELNGDLMDWLKINRIIRFLMTITWIYLSSFLSKFLRVVSVFLLLCHMLLNHWSY